MIDHGQVVGIGNGFHVAGQPDGEGCQRDALRQATACSGALDVEGGTPGGLADGRRRELTDLRQALGQAHGGGRLAFTQRGGGDGCDIDIARRGLGGQALHGLLAPPLA